VQRGDKRVVDELLDRCRKDSDRASQADMGQSPVCNPSSDRMYAEAKGASRFPYSHRRVRIISHDSLV
jgi:hypothetical protein